MASGAAALLWAAAVMNLLMITVDAAVFSRILPQDAKARRKGAEAPEWQPAYEMAFSRAARIVDEINMPRQEFLELMAAAQAAAGGGAAAVGGTMLVTTFDRGMVDLAQNMLRSLELANCQVQRLVVGIGPGVCESLGSFEMTSCVPVFHDYGSPLEAAWGSPEYWEVVFRKHVILSAIAASNISGGIVYSDPDVVFIKGPVAYLKQDMEDSFDILFTSNNMLERNASSLDDLAEQYSNRGLSWITVGPNRRHPDINSGLFYMRTSPVVLELFLRATECLRKQKVGHYQQFCLTQAVSELDGVRVGVAVASEFANGNVFWGHRRLLHRTQVVSIHANWMQKEQKRRCLQAAGLWFIGGEPQSASKAMLFENHTERVVMDKMHATVKDCFTE